MRKHVTVQYLLYGRKDGIGNILPWEIDSGTHRDSRLLTQVCPCRVQHCDSGVQAPTAPLPAPSTAVGATPSSLQA